MKNNKGLSYVEVMIVLGIGAILTSLAFIGLGFISRNNVTKSCDKLETAFSHAQSMSMAKGSTKGSITIVGDSGSYYYYFGPSSTNKTKFAQSPCVVTGVDAGDGSDIPIGSTGLRYYFVANTGGIQTTDTDSYNAHECYTIRITNGSGNSMDLNISKITGKVSVD